ncbi:MAG: WD40 repeat domain-containing protein [Candidatus Promineifilaceae bacterium]
MERSFIAAGGWDDCLWVWRASDLQPLYGLDDRAVLSQRGVGTMAAPPQFQRSWLAFEITDLAFSPDGQTLAAASGYGIVRLWNLQDGTLQGSPSHYAPSRKLPILLMVIH